MAAEQPRWTPGSLAEAIGGEGLPARERADAVQALTRDAREIMDWVISFHQHVVDLPALRAAVETAEKWETKKP